MASLQMKTSGVSRCIRLESWFPSQAWGGVGRAGLGDPQPLPWWPAGLSASGWSAAPPCRRASVALYSPLGSPAPSLSACCGVAPFPAPSPTPSSVLQGTPLLVEWEHIPTVPLGTPGLKQRSCQPRVHPTTSSPPSKLSLLHPPWTLMGRLLPLGRSPHCSCTGPSLVTASSRCVSLSSWWQVLKAGPWLSQLGIPICTRLSVLTHLGPFSCQAGPWMIAQQPSRMWAGCLTDIPSLCLPLSHVPSVEPPRVRGLKKMGQESCSLETCLLGVGGWGLGTVGEGGI